MKNEENKLLDPPCSWMGDELALQMTVFHYWCATIIGWSWAIVGLMYHLHQFIVGEFVLLHFAAYWVVNAYFAMRASHMTMDVYKYKLASAFLKGLPQYSHLVEKKEETEEETEEETVPELQTAYAK